LERYRKRVEEIEQNNAAGFHQLKGIIGEVQAGQQRVIDGANRITTTLRGATKARGDWGELQFENLLESCGLRDRTDFNCQVSISGSDGVLRPDGVINIPGGKRLVVDVKNVFNTYAAANEAATDEERSELLRAHSRELRGHIDELSAKRYQDHIDGSADFVVMFVPGEHVLYAALTQDAGLLEYALQRQVVLSSPLNFMSIALTVATIWRQAGVQADAKEIARLGKELYDRLAKMSGLLAKVGNDLARTNRSFNTAIASFESRLVPTGRKFEGLSVDTNAAEMETLAPIEIEPRQLLHGTEMPAADEDDTAEAAE
jgi:DNA recombination protein RmuC